MHDDPHAPIRPATLSWEQGTPLAPAFDDPYFSRDHGVAETRHVFLEGNQLPQRFAALGRERFVIAETGFGTGLNLLSAAALFLATAPAEAELHFISTEAFPLRPQDLIAAHHHWPQFAELAAALQAVYPALTSGFHVLTLHPRIRVTLLLGDACQRLSELDAEVDAWFLDGFAPARNPDMWSASLFAQLQRLSAPGASLATFTAAGFVRRGLIEAGFAMTRVPGFGRKREMLVGHASGLWQPRPRPQGRVAVIGAGLAGATSARALAEAGYQVTVLEAVGVASQASGNHAGLLYTTPSAHPTPQNRFYQSSYLHALRWLQRHDFPRQPGDGRRCGVYQLAPDARHARKHAEALASGRWPDTLLGAAPPPWPAHSLWLPHGAVIHPPAWCRQLLAHAAIELQQCSVRAINARADGRWALHSDHGCHEFDQVVIATAAAARQLAGLDWLPLREIRGQTTLCRATAASSDWSDAVCHSSYLTPALDGLHCVGATFDLHRHDAQPTPDDDARNLAALQQHLPDAWQQLGGEQIVVAGQRVAFRCQSSDFLPLVGPVPDPDSLAPQPGLFLNVAHGSRGLSGTPLAADLLVAQMSGAPLPSDRAIVAALAPVRFLLRQQRRADEG